LTKKGEDLVHFIFRWVVVLETPKGLRVPKFEIDIDRSGELSASADLLLGAFAELLVSAKAIQKDMGGEISLGSKGFYHGITWNTDRKVTSVVFTYSSGRPARPVESTSFNRSTSSKRPFSESLGGLNVPSEAGSSFESGFRVSESGSHLPRRARVVSSHEGDGKITVLSASLIF
jgi:hypothetical protein